MPLLPGIDMSSTSDVESAFADRGEHILSVGRLPDDLDIAGCRQQLLQSRAHDRVIVGQQHPNHVAAPAMGR